eukprot:5999360-Pyramimonas_sp.AAC.1
MELMERETASTVTPSVGHPPPSLAEMRFWHRTVHVVHLVAPRAYTANSLSYDCGVTAAQCRPQTGSPPRLPLPSVPLKSARN